MSRSAFSCTLKARDGGAIRHRMHDITQERINYGCESLLVMLRREGWRDNHKRVHGIYKEEGLSLRQCRLCRSSRCRQKLEVATARNTLWVWTFSVTRCSMYALPVLDHFIHECLEIVVDHRLVQRMWPRRWHGWSVNGGRSNATRMGNGSELASKVMGRWLVRTALGWISPCRVRRRTMRMWRASAADCGTNG